MLATCQSLARRTICSRLCEVRGSVLQLDGSGETAAHMAVRRTPCRRLVRPANLGRIHAPDTTERSLDTAINAFMSERRPPQSNIQCTDLEQGATAGRTRAAAVILGRQARQHFQRSLIFLTSNSATLCSGISDGVLYMISIGSVQFRVSRSTCSQHITFRMVLQHRMQLRSTSIS